MARSRRTREDVMPFLDFLLLTLLALVAIASQRLDVESIPVEPPRVGGGVESHVHDQPRVLELDAEGRLFENGRPTTIDAALTRVRAEPGEVLLRVDARTPSEATLDHVGRLREVTEAVHVQVERKRERNAEKNPEAR